MIRDKTVYQELIPFCKKHFSNITDNRTNNNALRYTTASAAMGALSIFLMQDQSFLEQQKRLNKQTGSHNFKTFFGIEAIPTANQIRNILDCVAPNEFNPLLEKGLQTLDKFGGLKQFEYLNDSYLIAIDGTEYHSSKKIFCKSCNSRQKSTGVCYYHSMLCASIVSPNIKEAIAITPEFIVQQDGYSKQDCENTAVKRWLKANGKCYLHLNPTILGDDLYSRESICLATLEQGYHFIFVCKTESHKTLYEYLIGAEIARVSTIKRIRYKKTLYECKFINNIPIKDGDGALNVNWLEIVEINHKKKRTYKNSFITDHHITKDNVLQIALAGRCRWKIENENNNTLKTKGYNFEHNYGHGKKHLASVFAILSIIAFLFHTIMNIVDVLYIKAKAAQGTRQIFYNMIRAISSLLIFESWESMLIFILKPPDEQLAKVAN